MSVLVAQLGARMHYAVPRILHAAGQLDHFYTDICGTKGWPMLLKAIPKALRPAKLERLVGRIPKDIPADRITAFSGFGIKYARRLAASDNTDERNAAFLWGGKEFNRKIIVRGLGNARSVYVFNSAGLELLEAAHRRGLKGVVEQTITPRKIEWQLLLEEQVRFAHWEKRIGEHLMSDYCDRELAEWTAADLILCASPYVQERIIACGGAPDKCVVVPYGIEVQSAECGRTPHPCPVTKTDREKNRPLRVLTVGAVGLRKGSPYVLEAAKKMRGIAEFRMVGAIQVSESARTELESWVDLTGSIPRSEMSKQYEWADVFLLPSLCEGSATSTYEALGYGLPVICTPNTGSVARDGVEGFIVPAHDSQCIVEKLEHLATNLDLLAWMSDAARQLSEYFTLEKYAERLIATLQARMIL